MKKITTRAGVFLISAIITFSLTGIFGIFSFLHMEYVVDVFYKNFDAPDNWALAVSLVVKVIFATSVVSAILACVGIYEWVKATRAKNVDSFK